MYLFLVDGVTVPRLARHCDRCEAAMRHWVRPFEVEGLKAVHHQQRDLGPHLPWTRTGIVIPWAKPLTAEKGIVM